MPRPTEDRDIDWRENRLLIKDRLDKIEASLEAIKEAIVAIEIRQATLYAKMGIWAAIAGALPSTIAAIFLYFKGH